MNAFVVYIGKVITTLPLSSGHHTPDTIKEECKL